MFLYKNFHLAGHRYDVSLYMTWFKYQILLAKWATYHERTRFSGEKCIKQFLLTKPVVYTRCAIKHHINIQADENFLTKKLGSEKRTKPYRNVYCVQQPLLCMMLFKYTVSSAKYEP